MSYSVEMAQLKGRDWRMILNLENNVKGIGQSDSISLIAKIDVMHFPLTRLIA
jgi:hypothetical protein